VTDFVEHRECKDEDVWGGCDRAHYGPAFDEWELIRDIYMIDPMFLDDEADRLRAQILELGGRLDMPLKEARNLAVIHRDALTAWNREHRTLAG